MIGIVSMCFIYYCYEVTVCNLMFQCILGLALENLVILVLQYLICKNCFLPCRRSIQFLYIVLTVLCYALFDIMAYLLLVRKNVRGQIVVERTGVPFYLSDDLYFHFSNGRCDKPYFPLGAGWRQNVWWDEVFSHTAVPYFLHCGKCDCQSGNRPFAEHDIPNPLLAAGKKDDPDTSEGKGATVQFQP